MKRIACLLLVSLGGPAHALTADERFLPSDLARLAEVAEPAFAPDGETIAYSVSTANLAEDKTQSDLWRVRYDGQRRSVTDGPFAEAKELVAGYTLIQVRSRDEALEWARRFPNPAVDGGRAEIEVRPLFELEDFTPSVAIERFREMKIGNQ